MSAVSSPNDPAGNRPSFVSTQVSEARRYYLDLSPKPGPRMVVVCGGCERMRPDYQVQRRTFPFLAVEFVAEGEGALELAGRSYALRPGMAFAYGPGAAHLIRNEPARPMLKYYVDFAGADAERLLGESALGGWRAVQVSSPTEVGEIFELLQREGSSQSRYGARLCAELLPVLLTKITERAVVGGASAPRALATYQRAKQWMEKHYLEVKTVEAVAVACHVELAYLCRLFRRFAHTTPYQFLLRLRLNRATELLLDGGLMVKEVAEQLDFADAFHFSRTFKRVYGLAPDQFLKRNRVWIEG
jgi:AraC-like DNA-binding protein